jgi:hypothetical protein
LPFASGLAVPSALGSGNPILTNSPIAAVITARGNVDASSNEVFGPKGKTVFAGDRE